MEFEELKTKLEEWKRILNSRTLRINNLDHLKIWKYEMGIDFSLSFMNCAEEQLVEYFEKSTNIKIKAKYILCTPISKMYNKEVLFYNITSKFRVRLFVHNLENIVSICWQSKSGRIYKVSDEDVDCNDIEFWFEGLDAKLYHQQMLPPYYYMPYKFKNLPFELVIEKLDIDATVELNFNSTGLLNKEENIKLINEFLDNMVTKGAGGGVIHNFLQSWENEICFYYIDLGSVGIIFIKKLVQLLTKLNCFTKVVIN